MKIGFDAKRGFHNNTGLGNYSRTLLNGLGRYFPEHEYYLFNPKRSRTHPKPEFPNMHEVLPHGFFDTTFSSWWRSSRVMNDLKKMQIDLYHGLSHEIPFGIHKSKIRSVVTIHDLIFERYPKQFGFFDVRMYRMKFKYACRNASRVIAISEQTREDIINIYGIDEEKIDVCYQSCDPAFSSEVSEEKKSEIRRKYHLPERYFLSVGSIIQRKNLLNTCEALVHTNTRIPLVVIGQGDDYKMEVMRLIREKGLEGRVIFLSDRPGVSSDSDFQRPDTFAAIYQMAEAMVYPSYFEGFGIPVLEALNSRLPVVTSNVSCLPETGGDAALYVSPDNPEEIAAALDSIISDSKLKESMISKGLQHAAKFNLQACTRSVMNVYEKVLHA